MEEEQEMKWNNNLNLKNLCPRFATTICEIFSGKFGLIFLEHKIFSFNAKFGNSVYYAKWNEMKTEQEAFAF